MLKADALSNFKFAALLLCLFAFSGCAKHEAPEIIAGTPAIYSMIRDAAPWAKAVMLVEPGRCPGHYDMRPSDAAAVKSARYMLVHAFQQDTAEKLKSINPDIKITALTFGAVPVPEDYVRALKTTAIVLKIIYPHMEKDITENVKAAEAFIINETGKDAVVVERIKSKKIRAVSSAFHKRTAEYLGIEVLEYFGETEELTAMKLSKIKKIKPDFIISNYPGTHDAAAESISAATGLKKVIISNFPEKGSHKNMYINQWNKNVKEFKKLIE